MKSDARGALVIWSGRAQDDCSHVHSLDGRSYRRRTTFDCASVRPTQRPCRSCDMFRIHHCSGSWYRLHIAHFGRRKRCAFRLLEARVTNQAIIAHAHHVASTGQGDYLRNVDDVTLASTSSRRDYFCPRQHARDSLQTM